MANIIHKNITDPDIHKDKGIATAVVDAVYTANGLGSGSWTVPPTIDPVIITIPYGTMVMYAGSTAPTNWILCYGQEVSRSTYSNVFTAISTTYGVGNGTTTFNLPDCRGRSPAGKDNMGGSSAARLDNIASTTLGTKSGDEEHQLTTGESPVLTGTTSAAGAHTHALTNNSAFFRNAGGGVQGGELAITRRVGSPSLSTEPDHTHDLTANTSSTSSTHSNMQPSIIFNMIMYTGV